jgi:hypothetical protein
MQPAGRVIVNHHVAGVREVRNRRHEIFVAARDNLHRFHRAFAINCARRRFAEKKNFIPAGITNVQAHVGDGLIGEVGVNFAFGGHGRNIKTFEEESKLWRGWYLTLNFFKLLFQIASIF